MSQLPHHCGRCANRWNGLKTAHCGACHETFTTVGAFDKHRKGTYEPDTRRCVAPPSVGLVKTNRAYPCWGFPPKQPEATVSPQGFDSDGLSTAPEGVATRELVNA